MRTQPQMYIITVTRVGMPTARIIVGCATVAQEVYDRLLGTSAAITITQGPNPERSLVEKELAEKYAAWAWGAGEWPV